MFNNRENKQMKKAILTAVVPLLMVTSAAFGTQTLSFNDNNGTATAGTYNSTDTFNFDVNLTFSSPPSSSPGLSYWLEVPTALAPFITITGEQYFTFTIGTDPSLPKTFTDSSGADAGYLTDKSSSAAGDLGGTTTSGPLAPGSYQVSNISFSLSGAPAGT